MDLSARRRVSESPHGAAVRTRLLLEGPILPTLLRLAAPNVAVMLLVAAVSTADAFFIGSLGPDALAGISLVFPILMLMVTMANGGMGGGVASAIARALGAGRREDADALVVHALAIALVAAMLFASGALLGGPALYRALGGTDGTLEAALSYSNVIFAGAPAYWLLYILSSVVRGSGNMLLPAAVVAAGSVVQIALAGSLTLGWGPMPRLGVAGAGVAAVVVATLGSLVLLGFLLSGRGLVRLRFGGVRLRRTLLWEILRVGAPGSLNTVLTNLTVVLLTGLVGPFGTAAVAGYGLASRLEYLQIPLVFGLGAALVPMVGTNVGAGNVARARRVAWTGAALAAGLTGGIGLLAALFPHAWLGLFSAEPDVLATGATYLRIVGPVYGFLGLGLALYFASQGAGRLLWPLVAGVARLVVAAAGGWVAVSWLGGGLVGLFAAIAVALVVYGATVALAIRAGAWR